MTKEHYIFQSDNKVLTNKLETGFVLNEEIFKKSMVRRKRELKEKLKDPQKAKPNVSVKRNVSVK